FLHSRKLEEARRIVFPASSAASLRASTPEQLHAAAECRRGLFQLQITGAAGAPAARFYSSPLPARILEMTIAYCAGSTSRESVYHARLFFGLGAEVIHTLRTTPLSELPRLAISRANVVCAFQEAEWLWRQLLVETRPEARRQLVLVALQPPLPSAQTIRRPAERIRGG